MNSRTSQEEGVYHASENPDIQVFLPRRYWHIGFERSGPLAEDAEPPEGAEVIECFYASSAAYVPFYYAPKSCPRLFVWRQKCPDTFSRLREVLVPVTSDRVMFFRASDRKVLERHRFTVYRFSRDAFEQLPNGEFMTHRLVFPQSRETSTDVCAALEDRGYQVVCAEDLEEMRRRLIVLELTVDSEGVRIVD